MVAPLLLSALAFCQTDQPTPTQQPIPARQPAKAVPAKPANPESVADAARATREAREATPPQKVYRNKDVTDRTAEDAAPGNPEATVTPAAKTPPAQTASRPAKTVDEIRVEKEEKTFEAQGNIFKRQILVQKGKIIDIQNHSQDLYGQLNAWSVEHHRDANPAICWSPGYDDPYNKDWCAIGRGLQSAYDTSQRQLAQEKARLEQMQEDIRRKGYGNAVYDPD